MRNKSFKTFIKEYLKRISLQNTTDIKLLCNEILENPRMNEILFLYTSIYNKEKRLLKYLPNEKKNDYLFYCANFNSNEIEEQLLNLSKQNLSFDNPLLYYKKVYTSYISNKNKTENLYNLKLSEKETILKLKKELKISDYRICKELNIDVGNYHAFFYKNKNNHLSYQKCDLILRFLIQKKAV